MPSQPASPALPASQPACPPLPAHDPASTHLQHTREAQPLVLAGGAKVHGARDVGGAAVVLRARVQQQQRAGVHRAAGAGLGTVVDDGAIGASACRAAAAAEMCVCERAAEPVLCCAVQCKFNK